MPTNLAQDQQALQALRTDRTALDAFGKPLGATVTLKEPGTISFAGSHWPNLTTPTGKQIKHDVETALAEARSLVFRGLQVVRSALRGGDPTATTLMTTWFGARQLAPADDWWLGVEAVLSKLNQSLLADISVYYRGADAQGKPNDYPGRGVAPLSAHDVSGYAETYGGQQDLVIGLCRVFFQRGVHKERTIKLKGFDSVGGVLVHEMSHNLCSTLDHTNATGQSYYGTVACQALAVSHPRAAWYNADNIEYLCEEALYGRIQAPVPVPGGNVGALTARHEQAIIDASH